MRHDQRRVARPRGAGVGYCIPAAEKPGQLGAFVAKSVLLDRALMMRDHDVDEIAIHVAAEIVEDAAIQVAHRKISLEEKLLLANVAHRSDMRSVLRILCKRERRCRNR
jgi:hypothetical protein